MAFVSPIWLALLVPWAILTAWLLWGRRAQTEVPFLDLWRGEIESPRAKRAMQLPPLALLAAIAAVLLALLAAAKPMVRDLSGGPLVTVVLDRGISMSANGRLSETIDRAAPMLMQAFGPGPVDLVTVPDGRVQRTDRSDWTSLARRAEPVLVDTRDALQAEAREALARNDAPVIALSDRPLEGHPRVVQVAPIRPVQNVGIVHLAALESANPAWAQAMVTLHNQSDRAGCELIVDRNGEPLRQPIDLPPRGGQRDYFIDLPPGGRVLRVEIDGRDDYAVDDRRFLARERSRPRVEVRPGAGQGVTPDVRRVVDAYTKARPAGEESNIVVVGESLDVGQRGVVVASSTGRARTSATTTPAPQVQAHPVTENVDWTRLRIAAEPGGPPPGRSWTSVVTLDAHPILAVRDGPARQVWIGFDMSALARAPEFVVLWTNLLDWLAGGGETWASHELGRLGPEWKALDQGREGWPGLYRRSDDLLRAANAPDVRFDPAAPDASSQRLASVARGPVGGVELLPWLALAALGCLLAAALVWPRRRLTPPGHPLNV